MAENENQKAVFQIGYPEVVPYCSITVTNHVFELNLNR